MNKNHKEIIEEIKRHAKNPAKTSWTNEYNGNPHHHYLISNPTLIQITKNWVKDHKEIILKEFIGLLDSLYKGQSYEEKTITGYLLLSCPKLRRGIQPEKLDSWLEELIGWAEIDSLCQNKFSNADLLDNWKGWSEWLKRWPGDKNISKRRASLVLLTGPVSKSNDQRLSNLAFESINKLKTEKDILITKAVSWLLRDLIRHHKKEVEKYLEENKDTLPAIAIRETRNKLLTGKK